jgi:hypothetical protein
MIQTFAFGVGRGLPRAYKRSARDQKIPLSCGNSAMVVKCQGTPSSARSARYGGPRILEFLMEITKKNTKKNDEFCQKAWTSVFDTVGKPIHP